MAGAALGEVQVLLFVAVAALGEFWIAGARNVVFFNRKWSWRGRKVTSSNLGCEAGCGLTVSCSDHMVGSCSDRSRIGNDVSSVLDKFLGNFGESFCVAGAVFGEFGQ